MVMAVKSWANMSNESMSVESISRRHQPAHKHRIRESNFEPGTKVVGAAIRGTMYLMSGDVRFTLTSDECKSGVVRESVDLKANDVVEFLRGEHSLEVTSPCGASAVFVWAIPI